jgi:uncharacterized membrane protein YbaN (DUF454 family)
MSGALRQAGGVALIVVGIIGCILPVMPGIPFLIAGAAMLGTDHVLVRSVHRWLRKKGIVSDGTGRGSGGPNPSEH